MQIDTGEEVWVAPHTLGTPGKLCQSEDTGEEHVLCMPLVEYVLRPEVRLCPEVVLAFVLLEYRRDGVVGVDLLQRGEASVSPRLSIGLPLVEVQVHMAPRGHDDIMPRLSRSDTALLSTPAHHGGIGG